jgi:hypothetical protein
LTVPNQTLKPSCSRHPTTTDIKGRFLEAYEMLADVCYIPEKHKKGYISFIQKSGIPANQMPTSMRVLQKKIDIDARLGYTIREIYKVLQLADFSD